MKKFEEVSMKLITFDKEDVITTSSFSSNGVYGGGNWMDIPGANGASGDLM